MPYIIPYINFNIKSSQEQEVILERLIASVNIVPSLSFTKTESYKDFEGVLQNYGFNLRRNIKFGYSAFLPILSCEFYKEGESTRIAVNIQFHKYLSIGIIIFLLFQISFLTLDLYSIVVVVLPYIIIIYLFNREVQYLKEKFNEIIR